MRKNIGLFHGKRIDNGEWVEGSLFVGDNGECEICYGTPRVRITYDVYPDTIGECCGGLKDKNGKVAFEHDVTADQWGRRWIIFRCKGGYGICRDTEWKRNNDCSKMLYNALADAQNADWFSHQHEIIGNIHDNPELLKEGADE